MVDLTETERKARQEVVRKHQASLAERAREAELKKRKAFGMQTEDHFWKSMIDPRAKTPFWFRGLRKATNREDQSEGIDFVAVLDTGDEVNIQIKSSWNWIDRFWERHPTFKGIVLVVWHQNEPEIIRKRTFDALYRKRGIFLQVKKRSGGQ